MTELLEILIIELLSIITHYDIRDTKSTNYGPSYELNNFSLDDGGMVNFSPISEASTAIKAYFAYLLPVGINAMRSTSYMENGHDKEFTVSFLGGM